MPESPSSHQQEGTGQALQSRKQPTISKRTGGYKVINRTYQRVGHVFQGRYKAILVEKDSYLLELARYVVLNPVRAGLINDASQCPWSSYAATLANESRPPWLQADWILAQFSDERRVAIARMLQAVPEQVHIVEIPRGFFIAVQTSSVPPAAAWPA